MTDEELVRSFETCALDAAAFTHAAHVRVAWWYLRDAPFPEALAHFSQALRRFAARHGATMKYHETITVAYMALIAERLAQTPDLDWPAFAARHPELLARNPSILARYYADATLQSELAKRTFVLPDRHSAGRPHA
jgi:hypothetical protein